MNTSTVFPRSSQTLRDNIIRIVGFYLIWLSLYFGARYLSKQLIPQIQTFKTRDQMLWGLSIVRALCGLLTLWSARLCFYDGDLSMNHVYASTDESWLFLSILISFFLFEETTLIYSDLTYRIFSKELHFHHIFACNGLLISAYTNTGHYYVTQTFMLEGITPCACICWCLLKLKLEQNLIWKYNQWILIYLMHSRTFYELWCWSVYYREWNYMKRNLPWIYIVNLFVGLSLVTVWLTPYWTYLKTAQFFFPVDSKWDVTGKTKKEEHRINEI